MNRVAADLAELALRTREVAHQALQNGMDLMAYPHEGGVLLGLGYEGDAGGRLQPEQVLLRRSRSIDRYGAWLPCRFADGSWYVLTRRMLAGAAAPEDDDWQAARELLE
jgi:hypothetical protein